MDFLEGGAGQDAGETVMIILVLAYLAGAVPCGYLLNRLVQRQNGTAWLLVVLQSRGPAAISILADFGKGALVAWAVPAFGTVLAGSHWSWLVRPLVSPGLREAATLIAAVAGHVLSVYVCGWGGRGTSTAFGAFMVLAPLPTACALGVFALCAAAWRAVGIGAVAASWALPPCIWYFDRQNLPFQLVALALAVLSVATHLTMIKGHAAHTTN